jgi:F-type H+-transporting ATPase subunit a
MKDEEIGLTRLFNDHLAGLGNSILGLFHQHAEDPARPWANFIVMQIVVALIIVILFAVLRSRLSVDKPGKLQQIMEELYGFLRGQAEENVGHHGKRYLPLFGTLFIFILFANLIGTIPGLASPTQYHYVPAGCALIAFFYYNWMGIQENGAARYFAHFAGPKVFDHWVPNTLLAILMVPIEIISHLARPMSLTIRLFANMFAGEKVTVVFLSLTYLVFPALFMGLHVFVGFLQAYIFALLTMVYVGSAVAHEH